MRVPKDNPFDTAWPALAGTIDRFVCERALAVSTGAAEDADQRRLEDQIDGKCMAPWALPIWRNFLQADFWPVSLDSCP
jgi:hypothetical protein